jgi:hypothetical protein
MKGETLQELKTTKTWLGQKEPGYASCEQWFLFLRKFSSPGNKKNRVQSICVKVFFVPQKMPQRLQEFEEYFL